MKNIIYIFICIFLSLVVRGQNDQIQTIQPSADTWKKTRLYVTPRNENLDLRVKDILLNDVRLSTTLSTLQLKDDMNNYWLKTDPVEGNIVGTYLVLGKAGIYPTIAAAVTAANVGDTIYLFPGIYYEKMNISKNITIIGLGGVVIADSLIIKKTCNIIGISVDKLRITGEAPIIRHFNCAGFDITNGSPIINFDYLQSGNPCTISGGTSTIIINELNLFSSPAFAITGGRNNIIVNMTTCSDPGAQWLKMMECDGNDDSTVFQNNYNIGAFFVRGKSKLNIKNSYGIVGWNYVAVLDSGSCYIDNTKFNVDVRDTVTGLHCLETGISPGHWMYTTHGHERIIAKNSTFSMTGYSGRYKTAGNPLALYSGDVHFDNCIFEMLGNTSVLMAYRGIGACAYGTKHIFTGCTFNDFQTTPHNYIFGVGFPTEKRCQDSATPWFSDLRGNHFNSTLPMIAAIEYNSALNNLSDGSSMPSIDTTTYDYPEYKGLIVSNNDFDQKDKLLYTITGSLFAGWEDTLMPFFNRYYSPDYTIRKTGNIYSNGIVNANSYKDIYGLMTWNGISTELTESESTTDTMLITITFKTPLSDNYPDIDKIENNSQGLLYIDMTMAQGSIWHGSVQLHYRAVSCPTAYSEVTSTSINNRGGTNMDYPTVGVESTSLTQIVLWVKNMGKVNCFGRVHLIDGFNIASIALSTK